MGKKLGVIIMENNEKMTNAILVMYGLVFIALFILMVIHTQDIKSLSEKQNFQMDVLQDITKAINSMNNKIHAVLNAHNTEVESWFLTKTEITETWQGLFGSMKNETFNGTKLDDFNECIARIKNPILIYEPHIDIENEVDGYVIKMYDSQTADQIGRIIFTRDFGYYENNECGLVYYNTTSKDLSITSWWKDEENNNGNNNNI